jgi:cephalosporin-C deacetylase-like acetyl esterase
VETEKMRLTTKEPEDFDAFWAEAKAKLAAVPVNAKRIEATPDRLKGKMKVYAVEIDCYGPRPATGWLFIPENAKEKSLSACAQFDGYNGNEFKVPQVPEWIPTNRITLCINAHGYEMVGHDEQYYKDYGNKVNGVVPGAPKRRPYALEPSEYDNPREAYFYFMAMRVMRAFDYLKTLPEWDGRNLEASGGSQGGLQTMWAAGLVDGLTAARPEVTWGCDLGNSLREGGPLISNTWGIPHADGAFYFDAALHAKRVPATCKVEITRLALGDLACPPRGVLLSYYNMKCPVSAKLVQGSTHGYVPPAPNQTFTISK